MTDYNNGSLKYVDLKEAVGDSLVTMIVAFKERKQELLSDKRAVKYQIKTSSEQIRKRAQQTLSEVKDLVGLLNVKF